MKLFPRFGFREPADDASNDLWQDDGADPVVEPAGTDNVDDYDPLIHDDPNSPDYRDPKAGEAAGGEAAPARRPSVRPQQSLTLGADAVAAAVVAGIKANGLGQPQQQAPAPFDQKAFRQQIGYREITEQDLVTILDPDKPAAERAAALNNLLDARERSVTLIAKSLFDRVNGQFEGINEHITEQRRTQARSTLIGGTLKSYPALKEYEDILPEIFESLRASGYRPTTEDQAVRALASAAQQTIRRYNKQFSVRPAQGQPARQMAGSVNVGGHSGAPKQVKKAAFNELWDS